MPAHPAQVYALKLLAIRARTVHELEERLQRKGYGEDVVRPVLERLKAKGLVDDATYARNVAEYRLGRGEGPGKIRAELAKRGIEDEAAAEALKQAETASGFDELTAALAQARKHLATMQGEPRETQHRRIANYLKRRGFAWDIIYRVLSLESGITLDDQADE